MDKRIDKILQTKRKLVKDLDPKKFIRSSEEEGGCGVVGFCCSEPVPGKHIYEPSRLMHNRGNGKGGGIAAVGFDPKQLGVSREVLDNCYMVHIAYLDISVRKELEDKYIHAFFDVEKESKLDTVDDWTKIKGLAVKPPDVYRYFVRVKKNILDKFISDNDLSDIDRSESEDEFVNQNSFNLNHEFYVEGTKQKAFVLSHGRNIMILKVVGYAETITEYYKINDLRAHIWIAHQRYPTRGRVWHPGGAHPFMGMDMALVHNGDFANYHSVTEYLMQRNIYPQFVTDTEVSALMFDLLTRTYQYPLEYIIEAIAPTTELDFDQLPVEKQKIYRAIQASHIHGSPDGPWFFIIARNLIQNSRFQLLGITDTAMLRPQVFAFADGEVQVGLICSEKQAIDATLQSLANDDKRICPVADRYWNARGGSHSDGGAFLFDLVPGENGKYQMTCKDKFGKNVFITNKTESCDFSIHNYDSIISDQIEKKITPDVSKGNTNDLINYIIKNIPLWTFNDLRFACLQLTQSGKKYSNTNTVIKVFTVLNDLRFNTGNKKRSHILHIVRSELNTVLHNIPKFDTDNAEGTYYRLLDYYTRDKLRAPGNAESILAIDANHFPAEGYECDAMYLVRAYKLGWKNFIVFNCSGQRYVGCGLGPETSDVTIDVYGSAGDYLGSGIDGLTIIVHGNAQDQLGQIIKDGKMVVYGDVGQTFLYGAKGASVYIMGNAAGRPLINSVGKPRVVINGTALDFLGESFMAGDVYNGGGFVIVNAIYFDDNAEIKPLPEPYPGSNLFSLASGGAAFIRDPKRQMVNEQLNGCVFSPFKEGDWELIVPYLKENEKLFGIKIEDLLTVNGERKKPSEVYRKVIPSVAGTPSDAKKDVYGEEESIDELDLEKEKQLVN